MGVLLLTGVFVAKGRQDRQASFYVDLSGDSLFKRGWRTGHSGEDKGDASIKENLAAGLIAASPWQPGQPFYDPFCGSGTIAIEAAQIADREELVVKPDEMQMKLQQMQAELGMQMMKADAAQKMADIDKTIAEIEKMKADAAKTMADAQLEGERLRLDQMALMMKERRDEIETTLKGAVARMATEQRDRSDTRRAVVDIEKARASSQGRLHGGQPMAGGF